MRCQVWTAPVAAAIIPTAMRNVSRKLGFVALLLLVFSWGAWLVQTASTDVQGTEGVQGPESRAVQSISVYSPEGPVAVKAVRMEMPTGLVGAAPEVTHGGELRQPW
ncbi:MAG: hypothetical protein OXE17_00125 [Chloroflexi bacterium]|nr:hypothetical protein [Chloroflexota bacterium]